MKPALRILTISKTFVSDPPAAAVRPLFENLSADFFPGMATGLAGPSGCGKSTLLKMIYGSIRTDSGSIQVLHQGQIVDMTTENPVLIRDIRRHTIGYASPFMHLMHGVPVLETVMETLTDRQIDARTAEQKSREILKRLKISENLWHLPPARVSSGERQRILLARCLAAPWAVLLLDNPMAFLDAQSCRTVLDLIRETVRQDCCIIGVFNNPPGQKKADDRVIRLFSAPV